METNSNTSVNINASIYFAYVKYESWELHVAATSNGVCYIGAGSDSFDALSDYFSAYPPGTLVEDDAKLRPYVEQLIEYFQGNRKQFTVPFDLQGTSFQLAVWNALLDIPYGETCSYSDIAQRIQNPKAVRAVGGAVGANPLMFFIPCHRVIGKNGSMTGFGGGIPMKTKLLQLEGAI